ncbi:PIN domain-containing protein [Streptomyces sp. ODS28]|uniref:PIN domain-containing protein n=1 Tax=Streptomyces sp. ODS28 TaxID=3136688 RepID=UPI0031EE55F2
MIILDTCVLRGCGFGTSTDLLRALREAGAHQVAVPWMVLEELAAQKTIPYETKHQRAQEAAKALAEATPWQEVAGPPPLRSEKVREHWRGLYRQIVDVLPVSEAVMREALYREANKIAPCGDKKDVKTGARDATIWLSAVEFARDHPDETVYFVSGNTRDFGDGETYPAALRGDINELGDRFVHLTSLDDVFSRFTERIEVDEAEVERALALEYSLSDLDGEAAAMVESSSFNGYVGATRAGQLARLIKLEDATTIGPRTVQDIESYRIGESEWTTATVRWLIVATDDLGLMMAFVWETRVLLSFSECTSSLAVLRSVGVKPAEGDDLSAIPAEAWEKQPSPTELARKLADATSRESALNKELVRLLIRSELNFDWKPDLWINDGSQ